MQATFFDCKHAHVNRTQSKWDSLVGKAPTWTALHSLDGEGLQLSSAQYLTPHYFIFRVM